ncbi:MAG: hypothetical protein WAS33_16265 [Candidatus Promineifilaceae bacterium]
MTTNYWIHYPADYKKQIKPLLHQQMWLFGRDIHCPEGNLLYQCQFSHQRDESRGGSMYTRWEAERQIVLWGWGIWLGQAGLGGIFVNRYRAKPQFTAVPSLRQTIHREEGLPRLAYRVGSEAQAEAMRQMWADLLRWLAGYEAWVLEGYGRSWRQSALKPFNHAVTKLAAVDQLASQWQTLAEQSQTLPIKSYKH